MASQVVERKFEVKYPDIPIPKFKSKRINIRQQEKEKEESKPTDSGNTMDKNFESLEEKVKAYQNKEIIPILERNMAALKKHVSMLIQSIFDNLPNIPSGLRILCKIIHMLAKKKFPNQADIEYNQVLGNYLVTKWIGPCFVSPEHNGILDDFQGSEDIANNLMEILKVLTKIFQCSLYPPEDIRSTLNDYIQQIIPSVNEYYKELVAVNEDFVEKIRSGESRSNSMIKSRSICISIYEIQMICDGISRQKDEMKEICQEACNLAENIIFYNKDHGIFNEKLISMPNGTKKVLKPNQCFVVFHDLIIPETFISNYIEEFNKIQGFHKDLSEEAKILSRVKHLLKNFFLIIEDIKNMTRMSADGKISLGDVLVKYQEKLFSMDAKHSSAKDKTPVHIISRFLLSFLKQIDKSYSENNFQKLYMELFKDVKHLTQQLDSSISTLKLQLLKALEILKRNCSSLNEINEKKKKAIKKTQIRDFTRSVKVQLCITSPSSTKQLRDQQKNNPKKSQSISDKIEITVRSEKGCIHERFAIIRELAANGGIIGGIPPGRKDQGGEDIFNESLYHCENIEGFIKIFSSLPEVKEAIATGKDTASVSEAITSYYNRINQETKNWFKTLNEEETNMMMDEIENYICKRLHNRVYPSRTQSDHDFWKRCKSFSWVNYEHLEIIPRNRCDEMWEYAANILNQMQNRLTPLDKLECMVECFKTITQVLELAAAKEGGGGADDTLPIMIYVLLRACPERMHTDLNFISLLRDSDKMLAGEGYCFIQVRSAVLTIESLNHQFFKMSEEEFNRLIKEEEVKFNQLKK